MPSVKIFYIPLTILELFCTHEGGPHFVLLYEHSELATSFFILHVWREWACSWSECMISVPNTQSSICSIYKLNSKTALWMPPVCWITSREDTDFMFIMNSRKRKHHFTKTYFTWFCDNGGSWLNVSPALMREVNASAPHSLILEFGCWQTWRYSIALFKATFI